MRQGLLSLEGKAFNHQSLYGFAGAQTSTDWQEQESHERSLKMETEAVSKWPSHFARRVSESSGRSQGARSQSLELTRFRGE